MAVRYGVSALSVANWASAAQKELQESFPRQQKKNLEKRTHALNVLANVFTLDEAALQADVTPDKVALWCEHARLAFQRAFGDDLSESASDAAPVLLRGTGVSTQEKQALSADSGLRSRDRFEAELRLPTETPREGSIDSLAVAMGLACVVLIVVVLLIQVLGPAPTPVRQELAIPNVNTGFFMQYDPESPRLSIADFSHSLTQADTATSANQPRTRADVRHFVSSSQRARVLAIDYAEAPDNNTVSSLVEVAYQHNASLLLAAVSRSPCEELVSQPANVGSFAPTVCVTAQALRPALRHLTELRRDADAVLVFDSDGVLLWYRNFSPVEGIGRALPIVLATVNSVRESTRYLAPLDSWSPDPGSLRLQEVRDRIEEVDSNRSMQLRDIPRTGGSKPLLLVFWGTWCSPCVEELPDLQRLFLDWRADVDFAGLAYELTLRDPKGKVRHVVDSNGVTFPQYLLDGDAATLTVFGDDSQYPAFALFDRHGRLVHTQTGAITGSPGNMSYLVRRLGEFTR